MLHFRENIKGRFRSNRSRVTGLPCIWHLKRRCKLYIRVLVLTCRILAPGAGAGEMPSALNIRYPLIVAELWRRVPRPDHLSCARVNIFPAIFSFTVIRFNRCRKRPCCHISASACATF
jgi:hypothetical protein